MIVETQIRIYTFLFLRVCTNALVSLFLSFYSQCLCIITSVCFVICYVAVVTCNSLYWCNEALARFVNRNVAVVQMLLFCNDPCCCGAAAALFAIRYVAVVKLLNVYRCFILAVVQLVFVL